MSASLVNLVRHTVNFQSFQKIVTCVGGYGGTVIFQQPVRFASNKHYHPKGRKFRRRKGTLDEIHDLLNMKDPDLDTPDKVRLHMKKNGMLPRTQFMDTIDFSCTNQKFDEYVPAEGDGKSSLLSVQKTKDVWYDTLLRGKNLKDRRKLKQFDPGYNEKTFADMAQSQLIKTYTLLQDLKSNEAELHQLVTNFGYPSLVFGLEFKSFRWQFIESIEPPRVVHVRTDSMLADNNYYSQVTVRCHTKQILAIYDRFGRLMYGSDTVPRDVLEYVVFEKHIVNLYGEWRLHTKLTPEWLPPQAPQINTQIKPEVPDIEELKKQMNALAEEKEGTEGTEEPKEVKTTS